MFLGYQNNKIVAIAETAEELENNKFSTYCKIEETSDVYILNEVGAYVKYDSGYIAQQLEQQKAKKLAENAKARDVEYITTSKGKLKTQTPVGELKSALPLYQNIVTAQGGLPANSVRFYDADGNPYGNEAMTADEFGGVVLEICMAFMTIDAKSTAYTQAIIGAESIEALEAVILDYSGV